MAKGEYKFDAHADAARERSTRPAQEVFTGRGLDPMLDLRNKPFRECLMVAPYEEARPIKNDLDESGSMGVIPRFLATDPQGLPGMVKAFYPFLRHPQLCFCGIGDANFHERAPLQVGHFEGEGHKMDEWLLKIYLEGGGGSNPYESYELGLFVAARLVRADCFARGLKGYQFTIGDERLADRVRADQVLEHTGIRIDGDIPIADLFAEVARNWHAFYLIPDAGRALRCEDAWRPYLGDNVIVCPTYQDIPVIEPGLVGITEGTLTNLDDYDRIMLEQLGRTDRAQRSRVIATLEAYAATRGRAGESRPAEPTRGSKPRRGSNAKA